MEKFEENKYVIYFDNLTMTEKWARKRKMVLQNNNNFGYRMRMRDGRTVVH